MIIGFSRPIGFKPGSWLIRLWQGRTAYSHVFLVVYSNYTEQWLVYQASHGYVNCLTLDTFKRQNEIIECFPAPVTADQKKTIKIAQQLLHRPYGYWGLFKLCLARFGLKLPGDGQHTFHCSEFIAALMPELLTNSDIYVDYIEPVHLYRALQESQPP